MIGDLNKYENNFFFFRNSDRLVNVCNAPSSFSGLYIIYAYEKGQYNLIYIGISGRLSANSGFLHRKDGVRGRFLTGNQFGERREVAWSKKLEKEKIEHLKVHWFITYNELVKDIPREIEKKILQEFNTLNGRLPRWNNRL